MRLAIIRRRYSPFGGAERFIERLIPALQLNGINPTVFSEDWPENNEPARVLRINVSGLARVNRFRSFQKAATQLVQSFLKCSDETTLVQSHERFVGADIYRAGDGVHRAWIARCQREQSRLKSLLFKIDPYHRDVIATEIVMAKDLALHYVVNSTLIGNELQEYLNVPASRISLIPNGVDTQYFSPASTPDKLLCRQNLRAELGIALLPDSPVIVCVGSGFRRKGVFLLIEAVASLKDVNLVVCGKDKEIAKARAFIKALRADDRIAIANASSDVRRFLGAADIFALPSLYDPSSNAVLEALSCGLPVVISQDVGMADQIIGARAGIVSGRSVEELVDAFHLLLDPEIRLERARLAREFALQYDQNLVVQSWLDFYATRTAQA